MTRLEAAVCVVGGGPAGSAVARRLSQLGHAVVVIEKRPVPRPHIGESLSPGILPALAALDLRARVESGGFLRPTGVLLHWPPARGYRALGPTPGFQVERGEFDRLLLEAAVDSGARVFAGARVLSATPNARGGWDVTFSHDRDRRSISGCLLVDATGRASGLPGLPWTRTTRPDGCETLALSAYWTGLTMGAETRIEAGEDAWYWGAPLPDGRFNATVFVDADRCRRDARTWSSRTQLYVDLLRRSSLLAPCVSGYCTDLAIHDATCRHVDQPIAGDLIRVGEASFSIDPLSSQGVQAAIGSGLHAAAVMHTMLTRPDDRAIAEQFYRERQRDAVAFHRATAADAYARAAAEQDTPFWRRRATPIGAETAGDVLDMPQPEAPVASTAAARPPLAPGTRLQLDAQTTLVSTPSLQGSLIRRALAAQHPGLSRPTAFLGDVALAPLLECVRAPRRADEALALWSAHVPLDDARRIMQWLWSHGIIVAAASE